MKNKLLSIILFSLFLIIITTSCITQDYNKLSVRLKLTGDIEKITYNRSFESHINYDRIKLVIRKNDIAGDIIYENMYSSNQIIEIRKFLPPSQYLFYIEVFNSLTPEKILFYGSQSVNINSSFMEININTIMKDGKIKIVREFNTNIYTEYDITLYRVPLSDNTIYVEVDNVDFINNDEILIENLYPGTWELYIDNQNGNHQAKLGGIPVYPSDITELIIVDDDGEMKVKIGGIEFPYMTNEPYDITLEATSDGYALMWKFDNRGDENFRVYKNYSLYSPDLIGWNGINQFYIIDHDINPFEIYKFCIVAYLGDSETGTKEYIYYPPK